MSDNDTPAIVIDNGSGACKAGFAEEDAPTFVIPTVVGRPRNLQTIPEIDMRDSYVGDEVQINRGLLSVRRPIEHGIVTNWDDMETIWEYIYVQLGVESEDHLVLLTEAVFNPKANREKMAQIMFEKFHIPGLHVAVQGYLSFISVGWTSGMVCESGDGVTQVVPVYEAQAISSAIQRVDVGGRDLTHYMGRLLQQKGFSFNTTAEMDILQDMKENCSSVAFDFDSEVAPSGDTETTYRLPDGTDVTLGRERYMCPEALFQPKLLGVQAPGIHQCIHNCMMGCDFDTRRDLYCNILLTGGNLQFDGIAARMKKELVELSPSSNTMRVNVKTRPEHAFAAWIGGSILASLSTFQPKHICKQDYEEYGPTIVHRQPYFS